jgi:glycosyltransferase involved in cell wall biosynthesis
MSGLRHPLPSSQPVDARLNDPITVFIPLKHYHEGYLREALHSVLRQTRTDWRLLILVYEADASGFGELLRDLLLDPRVTLVHRQGRLLAGAYNTAMRAATTEFILPLLGDDMLVPEAVEVFGEAIRANPDVDVFHAGRFFVDGDGRRFSSDHLPTLPVTAEQFASASPVKHPFCWRVRVGLACGGVDETLDNFASDDYDFPWTMLDHGAVFHAIPKALYVVRDHREGFRLTTHVPRSIQRRGLRRILEKHGVAPALVRRQVRRATRGYLRQSLFRNGLHQWIRERIGFDARRGWREPHQ